MLDVPVPVAHQLIAKKSARNYTTAKADIQEADGDYLARVRDVYLDLARQPAWQTIACCDGDRLRSVEEISEMIWQVVSAELTRRRC